ncbi:hypothetical protein OROMI_017732 [Orobanche minor]
MRQMSYSFERVARAHHMCPCCEREDDFAKKRPSLFTISTSGPYHKSDLDFAKIGSTNLVGLAMAKLLPLQKLRKSVCSSFFIFPISYPAMPHKNICYQILQVLGVLAQIKSDKDSVEALVELAETADIIFHDTQALQKEVEDLEAKFDIQGQDTKSMEEI